MNQLRVRFESAEFEFIDLSSLTRDQQQASSLAQISSAKRKLIGLSRTGSDNHCLRKLEDFQVCAKDID
jgi:hypothetical protein